MKRHFGKRMRQLTACTQTDSDVHLFDRLYIQVIISRMAAFVINMSRKGKLLNPRELARRVTNLHDPAEGIEALRTQVNKAKGKRKTSWLADLAKD